MRNLALILLFANLVLLAWHHWLREPEPTQPRVLPDVPLLQAARGVTPPAGLRETAPRAGGSGSATPVAQADPAPTSPLAPLCLSLGPFSDAESAAAAAASLEGQVAAVRQRAADGRVWFGYWVRLEHATPDAAAAAVQRLHAAGRGDAYLIPGDEVTAVSLGVFSTRARANRLHDEIAELGEEPLIVDRFRDGTVYWLDLELPAGTAPTLSGLPAAEGPAPSLQPGPCPVDAPGG